jgi:hypothetical protein
LIFDFPNFFYFISIEYFNYRFVHYQLLYLQGCRHFYHNNLIFLFDHSQLSVATYSELTQMVCFSFLFPIYSFRYLARCIPTPSLTKLFLLSLFLKCFFGIYHSLYCCSFSNQTSFSISSSSLHSSYFSNMTGSYVESFSF